LGSGLGPLGSGLGPGLGLALGLGVALGIGLVSPRHGVTNLVVSGAHHDRVGERDGSDGVEGLVRTRVRGQGLGARGQG
jgi:hypothetical protein